MYRLERFIFINSQGESITLGQSKPYLLQSYEGSGGSEANVQMQKAPSQDGQTYIGTVLEPRTISFQIVILTDTEEEMYQRRAELLKVLNPKLDRGVLRYENEYLTKEIETVVDMAPVFPAGSDNKGFGFQVATFTLICPSPFWTDIYIESEEMADWVGGLAFPLELPMKFAGRSSRVNKVIQNKGNVYTPIFLEFTGPAVNPKVVNVDTGEFIKVIKSISENESLIISTAFGNKEVILKNNATGIESDAFGYIDLNSSFFQLKPGFNQLNYDADYGKENAKVKIKWKNRYIGV